MEDFEVGPTLDYLAAHYGKPIEEMRAGLLLADIVAHSTVARWFDRCAAELIPEFGELYEHLIEERIRALEYLIESADTG